MIDFSALVLAPAMGAFAQAITVTPVSSQPGQPAYTARGVWSSRPVEIPVDGEGVFGSQLHTVGIRLAEFAVPPAQGDILATAGSSYTVEDSDKDGQGGATLTLKLRT